MKTDIKRTAALLLLLSFLFLTLPLNVTAQQAPQIPEKIHPGPQNIKEKTTILVFLVWLWISVIVLGIFLRLKINEVDRLFHQKYFNSPKGRKFINPHETEAD